MSEHEPAPPATLADFIKDNSTLVTSLAAFIALTTFSTQITNLDAKYAVSATGLFCALLLGAELFLRVPRFPATHWRLKLFELALLGLVGEITIYWFTNFTELWVRVLTALVPPVLILSVCGAFAYSVEQATLLLFAKILKRGLPREKLRQISVTAFIFCSLLIVAAWLWMQHEYGGQGYAVHTPHFIQSLIGFFKSVANHKL